MVVGFMLEDCICKSQSQDCTECARSCYCSVVRSQSSDVQEDVTGPKMFHKARVCLVLFDLFFQLEKEAKY